MKQKGFTLVELLAVIIVIGLLATIALPQILNQFSNKTAELTEDEIKLIEKSAGTYAMENGKKYKGKLSFISINELVDEEVIDKNLAKEVEAVNPNTNSGVTVNYLGSTPIVTYEDMEEKFEAKKIAYRMHVEDNPKKDKKFFQTIGGLEARGEIDENTALKIDSNYTSGISGILVDYCGDIPKFEYIENKETIVYSCSK